MQGDQTMGEQGTTDTTLVHSSFGLQRRDQFQMRDSDMSVPIVSNYQLHRQAGMMQPLDHHPAVSSRYINIQILHNYCAMKEL